MTPVATAQDGAELYDISQELSVDSAVFPGDTEFSARWVMRMADGGACDVSTVSMSVHTGTHADAPSHYLTDAATIGAVALDAYLGPARVVELPIGREITVDDIDGLAIDGVERLLLKTGSAPDPGVFPDAFAHLSSSSAEALGRRGVRLVGIDTPSVDHRESKTLGAHKALFRAGVAILENLVLAHVPAGDYELIALPLKLRDLDASPVRAVLRRMRG